MSGPRKAKPFRTIPLLLLLLALLAVWACGQSAAPPEESAAPAPASVEPTAVPVATEVPAMAESETMLHLAVTPLPQDTFYPWLATSSGHLVFRPMWENLSTINPKTGVSEVYPQLAREWEVSPDASEYTFRLQEGVQFHFGHGEFTVKDVILTADQQMSDPLAGCKAHLSRFMGADSMTEMIENGDMEVIDDYTFKMKLAQPQVDVASWYFSILQIGCMAVRSSAQHAVEGDAMFESGPAGTGAYQFVERKLKEYARYEAVPYDHWRVNPEFKHLRISTTPEDLTRLALLLTGEANMVDVPKVLHQQAVDEGMEIIESPLPTVGLSIVPFGQYYVTQVNWNPDTEPWTAPGETGVLVRQAMNRAIDREQIINELFKGRGRADVQHHLPRHAGGLEPALGRRVRREVRLRSRTGEATAGPGRLPGRQRAKPFQPGGLAEQPARIARNHRGGPDDGPVL